MKGQDCGLNINFLSRAFALASDFGFSVYRVNLLSQHALSRVADSLHLISGLHAPCFLESM